MNKIDSEIKNIINNNLNITFIKNGNYILKNFLIGVEKNKNLYIDNFDNISYNIFKDVQIYFFFINCVDNAEKKIINNKIISFPKNNWKFFFTQNIMFNLPFTLEDVIFIPESYLKSCFNSNNKKIFITTLVHEKIHIHQRFNEVFWNNFINQNQNFWIKIYKNSPIFEFIKHYDFEINFNIIKIINPDTYYPNFIYIFKQNNNYYYSLLILKNNIIITKWFKINNNFSLEMLDYNLNKSEHPYEVYAYYLSEEVFN